MPGSFRADNCRAQRLAAGYTITRLAELANVSDWDIQVLENGGTLDVEAVQRVADALGIDAATLGIAEI